jgi:serine/threonine protein phosphatase 1
MKQPSSKHIHYPSNDKGRDFIVGDIHGCFDQLMDALRKVDFNSTYDRLFSVGDLIDRGTQSFDCVDLIYEDWFKPVQGNHEQLMWNSIIHKLSPHINCWMQNGGIWFRAEDKQLLRDIAERLQQLPLVISVGEGDERFNVVHAEIVKLSGELVTNDDIDNWTFTPDEEEILTWGRRIIDSRTDPLSGKQQHNKKELQFQSKQLSKTYVGHTPVYQYPVRVQRQIYLDTGCVKGFRENSLKVQERYPLTLACPQEKMCYRYISNWKQIVKYPYTKIVKYK